MVNVQKKPTMTVVAAALLDGAGRILLQQRAPGRSMAGLWEFPGGKIEESETAEAALVREIEEELGILLDPADLQPACFASDEIAGRPMILLLYLCRSWRGEPAPLDAAALRWATAEEMRRLPMPPADEPLIPLLEAILSRAC
jgi:8-oxo-dGTP diphosphatase